MGRISVILDTSFLISVFSERSKEDTSRAKEIYAYLRRFKELGRLKKVYVLWPVCCEFFNTRTLRSRTVIVRWEKFWREFKKELIFQEPRLNKLLNRACNEILEEKGLPSFVDRVIGNFALEISQCDCNELLLLVTFDNDLFRYRRRNIRIVQNPNDMLDLL